MKTIYYKIAAVLAFIIGAMAFVSGIQVLLGRDPGYHVLNWLPIYNYTMGFLTALVTAPLIWRSSKLAMPVALTTTGLHMLVMFILQTTYRDVVAAESIQAMTIRLVTWGVILILMFIQTAKNKALKKATVPA